MTKKTVKMYRVKMLTDEYICIDCSNVLVILLLNSQHILTLGLTYIACGGIFLLILYFETSYTVPVTRSTTATETAPKS